MGIADRMASVSVSVYRNVAMCVPPLTNCCSVDLRQGKSVSMVPPTVRRELC